MKTINLSSSETEIKNFIEELKFQNYRYNRDLGMTHEQLVKIGLGNEEMEKRYQELRKGDNKS